MADALLASNFDDHNSNLVRFQPKVLTRTSMLPAPVSKGEERQLLYQESAATHTTHQAVGPKAQSNHGATSATSATSNNIRRSPAWGIQRLLLGIVTIASAVSSPMLLLLAVTGMTIFIIATALIRRRLRKLNPLERASKETHDDARSAAYADLTAAGMMSRICSDAFNNHQQEEGLTQQHLEGV